MSNLFQPILGDVTAITIGTSDLENSLRFYEKLGFRELYRFDFPYSFIQITDGALIIVLRKQIEPFIALTYYAKNLSKVINDLENKGLKFEKSPRDFDKIKHYELISPEGLRIQLIDYMEGFYIPEGPSMLMMPPEKCIFPVNYTNSIIGMFGELALPVNDIKKSTDYWENLGFEVQFKGDYPNEWILLTDGLASIGLQKTEFFNQPAITYYAIDMVRRIEKLKDEGLNTFKERINEANIMIDAPDQQIFNLFRFGE